MKFPPLVFLTILLAGGSAFAATLSQVNSLADTSLTPYTVSNTDLLQTTGSLVTSSGTFTLEGQQGTPSLNDGNFGLSGSAGQQVAPYPAPVGSATGGVNAGSSVTFSLGNDPLGYNVTAINTYAGWDKSRYGQAFDIYVQYVGSPTFVLLQSVNYYPMFPGDTVSAAGPISQRGTKVSLTGFLGAVTGLRFDFSDPTAPPFPAADNYMGYREIDVLGSVVPEPSAFAMILLSAGILLSVRQRSQKSSR